MATDDDFWLLVHDLAAAVNSDDQPWKGKAATLARYFSLYPPVARKQLREEFRQVLGVLSELRDEILDAPSHGGPATSAVKHTSDSPSP
jgi:hypothetical protein